MTASRKIAFATGLGAISALLTFVLVAAYLGFSATPEALAALAISQPVPLLVLDVLKWLSALASIVFIFAFHRQLALAAPLWMKIATTLGVISVVSLVLNGALSLVLIGAAQEVISLGTGTSGLQILTLMLALVALVLNGVWFIIVHVQALKQQLLPRPLAYTGIGLGVFSVLPIAPAVILVGSVVWYVWMGVAWKR